VCFFPPPPPPPWDARPLVFRILSSCNTRPGRRVKPRCLSFFLSLALLFCPRPKGFKAPHLLYTQLLQSVAWTTREACMLFLSRPTQALGPPFFCTCSPRMLLPRLFSLNMQTKREALLFCSHFCPSSWWPWVLLYFSRPLKALLLPYFLACTASDGTRRLSVCLLDNHCLPDLVLQDLRWIKLFVSVPFMVTMPWTGRKQLPQE